MANDPERVVITGVSRGLGLELARGFAARGVRVFGCARNARAIEALAKPTIFMTLHLQHVRITP